MIDNANPIQHRTVVFFDGDCGLCSREIRWLRTLDRQRRVKWIDINRDMTVLKAFGVDYDTAMRRFHVLDHGGILRVGAPAFLALWSELPWLRLAARIVYITRSVALLDQCYERFATWRLRRRLPSACHAPLTSADARSPSV